MPFIIVDRQPIALRGGAAFKVLFFIIHEQHAYIIVCTVDTLYFDEHLNAYCVEDQSTINMF